MENTGRYKLGHRESAETRAKRLKSLKDAWKDRADFHGMHGTKFYNCWRSMITRCNGTAGKDSIKKYKDKGITVCDKWKSFRGFYEDMHEGFSEGLTIDRIDNYQGYFKENCRWATAVQQANNKRNNKRIEYEGKSLTLREWSELTGIGYDTLRNRYHKNYTKGIYGLDRVFRK